MLVALSIAGSDSLGGAGIEADVKAMASQGVHCAVAITAVTAQNSRRVAAIYPLTADEVRVQIDAVLEDIHVSSVKTGMLYSGEIASAVARRLVPERLPLVVDPVLEAGVGDPLGQDDLVETVLKELVPLATILTPNVPEASALTGRTIRGDDEVRAACRELAGQGAEAVLIKGGHLEQDLSVDTLYHNGKFLRLGCPRVKDRGHGGGCILSSYLTANLAKGQNVWEAFIKARTAIMDSIAGRYKVGRGVPIMEATGRTIRDGHRYQVASRLRCSALRAMGVLTSEWVPREGAEMVFALPGARKEVEVCGLRFPAHDDRGGMDSPTCEAFGTGTTLSTTVLAALRHDGGWRAAMSLRCTEENVRRLERAGLSIATFERKEGAWNERRQERAGMEDAIKGIGCVPDVIYDRGGPGIEPRIRLLAPTPEGLVNKIVRVLH